MNRTIETLVAPQTVRSSARGVLLAGYGGAYVLLIYLLRTEDVVAFVAAAGTASVGVWGLSRTRYIREVAIPAMKRDALFNALVLGAVILLFPAFFLDNPYWIHVATMCGLYVIMAQGLNVHVGDGGMVNLGYAAFFAIGAYTVALLTVNGWNFWLSVPLAVANTAVAAALIALCLLRSRGDYVALVTIGYGLIAINFAVNLRGLTRGPDGISGIPPVAVGGVSLNAARTVLGVEIPFEVNYYYLVVIVAAATSYAIRRIRSSYLGRAWVAISQDEIAAGCLGVNVPATKFKLFVIGSLGGGIAGALFVGLNRFVAPSDFTFIVSVTLISMVVVGGSGNMAGVTIGVILLYFLPEKLRGIEEFRLMVYAIVLIVLMIYRPAGLFPRRRMTVFGR